jgi:Family of unknown function (DUF6282)
LTSDGTVRNSYPDVLLRRFTRCPDRVARLLSEAARPSFAMSVYDELLNGAIDLHVHVDLEFSLSAVRKREPEREWLPKAEALGMRGVLLKSHWWPTAPAVHYIKQLYAGSVELWPSVTLNPVVGGVELWAAEAAAALGARVVFLPTWGSLRDLEERGFIHEQIEATYATFDPAQIVGTPLITNAGGLTTRARDLVHFCHEHDLTLATGHVHWREALAVIEEAHAAGYERVIFTHPFRGTPLDVLQRAASLGAYLEVVWGNIGPGRVRPDDFVHLMRQVGVERCVIASDSFRAAQPPPPELFRYMVGTLYDAGLTAAEIRTAAADNPARALGIELAGG